MAAYFCLIYAVLNKIKIIFYHTQKKNIWVTFRCGTQLVQRLLQTDRKRPGSRWLAVSGDAKSCICQVVFWTTRVQNCPSAALITEAHRKTAKHTLFCFALIYLAILCSLTGLVPRVLNSYRHYHRSFACSISMNHF